jgi:cardiolipin synthase
VLDVVTTYWPYLLGLVERVIAIWASSHAVLYKRETRAVIGWVGLIWLAPFMGSVLYYGLGINRLRRRGGELQQAIEASLGQVVIDIPEAAKQRLEHAKEQFPQFAQLTRLVHQLTDRTLLPGNSVVPLLGGKDAYCAMLAAIENATTSIAIQTYIFDNDRAGKEFAEALQRAHRRGVQVRVLVDDVGARYSRPSIVKVLQRMQIECHTFLPARIPIFNPYANLRNHRKIMVIDGHIGFTGGMNIRQGCRLDWEVSHHVHDIHFEVRGPVVSHLREAFIADWAFTTQEVLSGNAWLPTVNFTGDMWARGIPDGPDEDFEKLLLTILGAITVANRRIVIMTPYFLPDIALIHALGVAALRGVDVRIILPARSNNFLVQWASTAQLWQILERGCHIHLSSAPFDHSKLVLVDDAWVLFGSTNWDPRSLRLNFEFNVECYSLKLASVLAAYADQKISSSNELSLEMVNNRSIAVRLRDGVTRLLTPYL